MDPAIVNKVKQHASRRRTAFLPCSVPRRRTPAGWSRSGPRERDVDEPARRRAACSANNIAGRTGAQLQARAADQRLHLDISPPPDQPFSVSRPACAASTARSRPETSHHRPRARRSPSRSPPLPVRRPRVQPCRRRGGQVTPERTIPKSPVNDDHARPLQQILAVFVSWRHQFHSPSPFRGHADIDLGVEA